jgi:hypothetical protein
MVLPSRFIMVPIIVISPLLFHFFLQHHIFKRIFGFWPQKNRHNDMRAAFARFAGHYILPSHPVTFYDDLILFPWPIKVN